MIPIRTLIHASGQSDQKPIMQDVENELNLLGNEEWELVSVQDTTLADGRNFTVAYLKREKRVHYEPGIEVGIEVNSPASSS